MLVQKPGGSLGRLLRIRGGLGRLEIHSQLSAKPRGGAMTLEFSKISSQIDEMGRAFAAQAQHRSVVLPAARELLQAFADRREELRQVADSESGQRLRCASPGDEALAAAVSSPAVPDSVTLVATDGSQVYPDSHGLAFFYAINVGCIIFRHGSGQAPEVASEPLLRFSEDEVYPGGLRVSGDQVSAERDLAEIRMLASVATGEQPGGPVVALGDGPLLIWLRRAAMPEDQQARILACYLACMDLLRESAVAVAGFVSRPHSAEVVSLLYLAHLEPAVRLGVRSLAESPFQGLMDRALFGFLEAGQRSALFVRGTAANRDFAARGHKIYFFYLNTGSELARVEVPEWIAVEREQLDLVHAVVYDQCCINEGYPYVLTRADEQAVILGQERKLLEELLAQTMLQHGMRPPELSRKAQQKRVARWRRRRT